MSSATDASASRKLTDVVEAFWSAIARPRDLLLLAAILVPGAVAYRELFGFDPEAGRRSNLEGTEELFFEPASSSPLLIFAVTAWFIARRWPRFRRTLAGPSWPLGGAALLGAAAVLCPWAYYVGVPTFLIPSLSLAILGGGAWAGGKAGFWVLLLPAAFLLLAAPIPVAIVNRIIYGLQLGIAEITGGVLTAAGMEVLVVGDRVYTEGAVFQVIESCSGLRTMITLLMAAIVYQELFFRSRLHSALLVGAAPLLGMLTNQVRVIGIVLNPYSEFAAVHTAQGLVMIVLGIFLLAGLDVALARILPDRRPEAEPHPSSAESDSPRSRMPSTSRLVALAATLSLLAAATLLLEPWQPPDAPGRPLSAIPARIDDWSVARGLPLDRQLLGSVHPSEWIHRRYERRDEYVDLLVASDRRYEPHVDLFSPKTAIPASGWEIVERQPVEIPGTGGGELLHARSMNESALVYHRRIGAEPASEELLRAVLSLDRSLWRRPGRIFVVRIATPASLPGGRPAAERRLRDVAALVEAELAKIAP